jgi:hypothetical protein
MVKSNKGLKSFELRVGRVVIVVIPRDLGPTCTVFYPFCLQTTAKLSAEGLEKTV